MRFIVVCLAIMSETPTVKPWRTNQLLTTPWTWDKKFLQASGPYSFQIMWTIPPPVLPTWPLVIYPQMISPFWIRIFLSRKLAQLWALLSSLYLIYWIFGSSILNTYFPVHSGSGFKIAGYGIPSLSSIHIMRFIKSSWLIKVSLWVKSIDPRSES